MIRDWQESFKSTTTGQASRYNKPALQIAHSSLDQCKPITYSLLNITAVFLRICRSLALPAKERLSIFVK
jgi:hypothetical protein